MEGLLPTSHLCFGLPCQKSLPLFINGSGERATDSLPRGEEERAGEKGEITERPAGPVKAEKHQHVKLTDTGLSVFHTLRPV